MDSCCPCEGVVGVDCNAATSAWQWGHALIYTGIPNEVIPAKINEGSRNPSDSLLLCCSIRTWALLDSGCRQLYALWQHEMTAQPPGNVYMYGRPSRDHRSVPSLCSLLPCSWDWRGYQVASCPMSVALQWIRNCSLDKSAGKMESKHAWLGHLFHQKLEPLIPSL